MKRLHTLRAGEQIRAPWVHDLVRTVNELNERVSKLEVEAYNIGSANELQRLIVAGAANAPSGGGGAMPTSLTWTATSSTATSRTITDSNSDTFTWNRKTAWVMTASDGTNSYAWTFNMPTSV